MKKDKLIPMRRFKEFENDGAWEQRKLGEVAKRFDNLRIPVTASNRVPGNIPYYGANGIQDYVKGFTHDGEFVLIAEDGANDLNDYPVHYVNGKVWVNNHAHVIQAIEGISDNKFLRYLFKTLDIEPYLVGGSRAKLNADIMMNLVIYTPKLDEQIKLGKFFSSLDSLTTLHQSKLEKLKNIKLAYLSEMFPKEGEKYPKQRFAGFTDPWELRKLGEVTNIKSGSSDLKDADVDGKYPLFVRSENVKRSNRYIFEGEAILIPGEGRLGEIYHYINGKFDYHQRVYKISHFDEETIKGKFTLYYLQQNFKHHALKFTVKATVDSLRLPMLTDFEIKLPKIEEQEKISTFFNQLDNLITLHQHKLEKLENLKKAYLNEMFV